MSVFAGKFRAALLAGSALVFLEPQAFAATFNITSGTAGAQTAKAGETSSVSAGAAISTSGVAITWDTSGGTSPVVINNSGTISGATRGIDDNTTASSAQSFTFNNLTPGSILTSAADAFRINKDILGGTVSVNNAGTIASTGAQQALDFAAITSAATVNISNSAGAFIQTGGNSAIELGGGSFSITNGGTIQTTAAASRGINYKPASLTNLTSFALTNGGAANSGALISSTDDAVRLSAGSTTGGSLTAVYNVSLDNFGTIKTNGTGSGQAVDFSDLVSSKGTVTVTNRATGVLQSADADGLKAGNNSVLNNLGSITGKNAGPVTGNASGNDGVDFGGNAGTVNNSGSITGARHGITGKLAIDVENSGAITGQDGSGINMDTTTGTTIVNNMAGGTITGSAVSADGDAIDVDYLVNITNAGTIRAVGLDPAGDLNEALAIGGGTVTNQQGGVIISDQRAITVDDSNLGNAFGAVSIDNAGTITGNNGQAIAITSISANILTNRATGIINGNVAMGNGDDNINLYAGSTLNGALDGGQGSDTIHLMGSGSGTLANVSNVETLKVESGSWTLSGSQAYSSGVTVNAGATALVTGALGGDVTNNGTVKVQNATVSFTGTFQNNGAYISDPSTQSFNTLSVGTNGTIQTAAGDTFKIAGDFKNSSTQNLLWGTDAATQEFIGTPGTNHWVDLVGADQGNLARVDGYNFGWGELKIDDGNSLTLHNGRASGDAALYLTDLLGAIIGGQMITNIFGLDGLTIYYNAYEADNAYLGGLNYALNGGGRLVADVPEPAALPVLLAGMGGVFAVWRRRKARKG